MRSQINEIRNFDIRSVVEQEVDKDGSLRKTFTEDPIGNPLKDAWDSSPPGTGAIVTPPPAAEAPAAPSPAAPAFVPPGVAASVPPPPPMAAPPVPPAFVPPAAVPPAAGPTA